jgi:uridine monophosphate synthetase
MNFADKLATSLTRNQSLLCVGLDPNPDLVPARFRSGSAILPALQEWLKIQITETMDHVCAYKPTLGFYQALGVAGIELLLQVLEWIPDELPVILDAKHSDPHSSTLLAETVFRNWGVDAITLSPFAGQDQAAPFLVHADKAVFVLCRSASPTASLIQDYPHPESPLYLQIVKEVRTWGTPEAVGLEVASPTPEILAQVRSLAPERWILARSLWAQRDDLSETLAAGLDRQGAGLIIPVAQDLLGQEHLSQHIQTVRDQVNQMREQVMERGATCTLWTPNVCLLDQDPHTDLILQLFDLGFILFGEYVQASGAVFPYYVDLRTIISKPQVFQQILNAYAEILESLQFDRIAGIPYGSLPTATGLSLRLHKPMIYPRKEVKAHGTKKVIEGAFNPGEKVVVVDDIMISGKSALEGATKLKSAGLEVEDIVVFIDHEQGVKDRLRDQGYRSHSVMGISQITTTLYQAGRINREQYELLTHA